MAILVSVISILAAIFIFIFIVILIILITRNIVPSNDLVTGLGLTTDTIQPIGNTTYTNNVFQSGFVLTIDTSLAKTGALIFVNNPSTTLNMNVVQLNSSTVFYPVTPTFWSRFVVDENQNLIQFLSS